MLSIGYLRFLQWLLMPAYNNAALMAAVGNDHIGVVNSCLRLMKFLLVLLMMLRMVIIGAYSRGKGGSSRCCQ